MVTCKRTQGEMIVQQLRRKAMTYAEMHAASPSLSPQKRVMEYMDHHPELELVKGERNELVTWRVKKTSEIA